ncbi:VanZ family protein [Pseudalkalibacillus salsuginis]|uniref:VanZ family protein n=1 Tax=Pseudalkalibacillus salsuginis TaxID=2910972 RepID=UPI001F1575D2|nr:VanZ family protein [Pseudalkalibacillus salsuginis]MCF6409626.1 VanZ family protein [Pseudalkalibacillus salsuginis]
MGNNKLTFVLFIIYVFALIWLVLFKLQFSFDQIDRVQVINMIPLNESVFSEVYNNIRIFVPLGIYICMLKSKWSFMKKLLTIIGFTLAFEIIQFVLAIGRSDITDIQANTLGGTIGIGIYELLFKILKNRTKRFINVFALVLTSCAVFFIIFIFKRHM